ncbi:MAG TPA: YHS domain-containing (seleno)protein [Chryseolinea sp.]|nr:YHS domain-containing (seleno)protein [Chryseolinea sp.]
MRTQTILLIIISTISTSSGFGQGDDVRKKHFNIKDNLALEGFDPVSYFEGKPKEGKSEFRLSYKAVTYQFVSQSNLARFKTNPEKYEPAYGGWCAYAMGDSGEKVKIDPETFTILDGRLYLFYNFWGNNTLKDWRKDERKLQESGDRNWKSHLQNSK